MKFTGQLHETYQALVPELFELLVSQYPRCPLKEVKVYKGSDTDRSMANADVPGVIQLNSYWFTDRSVDELRNEARTGYLFCLPGSEQVIKWHGGMVEPQHVLCHEFGHVLSDIMPSAVEWAKNRWEQALSDPGNAVSGYALAGPDEYWAEAFAANVLEIDHPDAHAVAALFARGTKYTGSLPATLVDDITDDPKIPGTLPTSWSLVDPVLRADAVDFKEAEHPRDEDGKFTEGSGSSVGVKATHLVAYKSRDEWPSHIKKLRVPPAWTNVKVSPDPSTPLQALGYDAKGRSQYLYSEKFRKSQTAAKFKRVKSLDRKFDHIVAQNNRALKSRDPVKREHAAVTALIMDMGLRPGSERDTGAEEKAFGATTLQAEHVLKVADQTWLRFTGKKGVRLRLPVDNPDLAKDLRVRAAKGGQLFPGVTDRSLRHYVASLAGEGFKTKDLRTLKATKLANDLVQRQSAPTSMTAYKKAVKEVATKVAEKLGNTPTVALQSYISPVVFAPWMQSLGGDNARQRAA